MLVNEEELLGVSDQLPIATKGALKDKPTLEEVRDRIPLSSTNYQALRYQSRSAYSLIEGTSELLDYFFAFLSPLLFADWAVWANANAEKKKAGFQAN